MYKLRASEFDVTEFALEELDQKSTLHVQISHIPSQFTFYFTEDGEFAGETIYRAVLKPGYANFASFLSSLSWLKITQLFEDWLNYVKRELAEPDLWAALESARPPDLLSEDNSPFSSEERTVLRERLGQIKNYAQQVQPELLDDARRLLQLEAKLDYLAESSERMGRKDWLNVFVGTIFSIAMTGIVESVAAKDFIEFAWQLINQVLPALSA